MRILIAEDDFTSRNMLETVLTKLGHVVHTAVNGALAWQVMQQPDAPRLAIFDWLMPILDGVEVCRRIRTLDTDRPPYLILLTTKGSTADIAIGLEAGADDYITKPFDPVELCARINVGSRVMDIQDKLATRIEDLRDALDHIKTLQGFLPICSYCKKVRDDQGYWNQVEHYITTHSELKFTHGICPTCLDENFPEVAADTP